MEIFYNSSAPGYEEIASYGPEWWTEYKEMDAIYMFEGWLLDVLAKKMEQEAKNLFPSQADNQALIEYEKILGIEHDENMTVEERRRIVQAYYSGSGHLSGSVILQMAKTYTGFDTNLFWKDGKLYIELNNGEKVLFSMESFQKAVERRMPAHLAFIYRNIRKVNCDVGYSIACKEYKRIYASKSPALDPIELFTWFIDENASTLTDEYGNILII